MYFFIDGGDLPKNYSDEGGACKKNRKLGGVIQFSNYTPPNPTSPPYPIKNERSLIPSYRDPPIESIQVQ